MTLAPIDITERLANRAAYSLRDADYLAGNKPGTTRRWLLQFPKIATANDEGVSYYAALQMAAISELKRSGIRMKTILDMLVLLQQDMGFKYPFMTERFFVGGKQVFLDRAESLIEVGKTRGQLAWASVLLPWLKELEFEQALAARWWPMGRKNYILVSPDYGFGLPVVAGTFIRTEVLQERFIDIGSIAQVAREFELPTDAVEQAIRFESQRLAAA